MQVIYKYPLHVSFNPTKLTLPTYHEVLDIQLQNGEPVMWCVVNPECSETVDVTITVVGTGWEIEEDIGVYLRSWQAEDGYVYHAFYKI